jgi:hypothetical protein
MAKEVKTLTKEEAAVIAGKFDNKDAMSAYFGKWGKRNPNAPYIIGWCDDLIEEYQTHIANLQLLKSEMTLKTLSGVSAEDLKAALAALEGDNGAGVA